MPNLTQLYNTDGMMGSWELLKKFSIVGTVVQFFLTVYGLLSNVSCILRVTSTIFFLSNRRKFDEIDRVQSEGLSNAFKSAQGFNKVIVVLYCLLPNIKQLSDYGSSQFDVDDDDSIITYIVKSTPSTLAIITFSSMAFNGLLFQIYGNISDGLLVVAQQARDLPIAKSVDNYFNSGKDYTFSFNHLGTREGDQKYKISRSMYVDLCQRTRALSADEKAGLGSSIEAGLSSKDFTTAVEHCAEHSPQYKAWKTKNSKASVYDAVELKIAPIANVGKVSGFPRVGNSPSFKVPVTSVAPQISGGTDFDGYVVTVVPKVPGVSKFEFSKDKGHKGK